MLGELRTGANATFAWGDGTMLTFTFRYPWSPSSCQTVLGNSQYQPEFPQRLLCLPDAINTRSELWCRRLSIVSSRLPRRLDLEQRWFDLFRTSVLHAVEEKHSLVVVRGTATAEIISRAAVLFGLPMVDCEFWSGRSGSSLAPEDWLEACHAQFLNEPESERCGIPIFRIWISPEFAASDLPADRGGLNSIDRDSIAFELSTRVVVLNCRKGGNIECAIRHHLQSSRYPVVPVIVAAETANALGPESGTPDGWIPWIVDHRISSGFQNAVALKLRHGRHEEEKKCEDWEEGDLGNGHTGDDPLSHPVEWLCHWTRAAHGPWPDETQNDFLDQLILGCASADRSALAAILNIIATKKLRASSLGIRGGYAVVSLTEVPLCEFRQRRVFRKHRHRFDFEPFGIAIRKERLKLLGARPVVYGNDQDWALLNEETRPFYQKATRDSSTSNLDEQEWRVHGDILLADLPATDVVLFTDLPEQRDLLRQCTAWKVIVVPPHPDMS